MEPVQISSAASGSPPGRRVGGGATFRVSSAMRKELQDPLVCMTPRKPSCCCVLTLRTYQYDAASIYPQSFSPSVLLHTGVISQYFGGRYCFILRTSFLQYFGLGTASYCQYSQYFGGRYCFIRYYVPVSRSISAVGTASYSQYSQYFGGRYCFILRTSFS